MSKYKQRLIPSVTTPIHLKKATRIATLLYRNNGKIYWNHDVNKKKQ